MIHHSDALVRLDLSGNQIGDRVAFKMAEALIENTRLTDLNISGNR